MSLRPLPLELARLGVDAAADEQQDEDRNDGHESVFHGWGEGGTPLPCVRCQGGSHFQTHTLTPPHNQKASFPGGSCLHQQHTEQNNLGGGDFRRPGRRRDASQSEAARGAGFADPAYFPASDSRTDPG